MQLDYLRFILCRMLISSLTLYCTSFFTRLVQLTFSIASWVLAFRPKLLSRLYQT